MNISIFVQKKTKFRTFRHGERRGGAKHEGRTMLLPKIVPKILRATATKKTESSQGCRYKPAAVGKNAESVGQLKKDIS